jgi:ATP/maltotriose-dependent transcriptional regulator MalT
MTPASENPLASVSVDPLLGQFPLVGRKEELAQLEALLEPRHPVSIALISGQSGSGKTRLAREFAIRAERRGWRVARGRAYPVEQGVPYALFSDALQTHLDALDADTLAVLSRGGERELEYLFPALAPPRSPLRERENVDPEELRTRIFWNFAEFLKSYAARSPLLVCLDDLHWADASSLELIHFLARHISGLPMLLLCTYEAAARDGNPRLVRVERSLISLGIAQTCGLEAFSREQVAELVSRTFSVPAGMVGEFSALLYGWTRGNPFFVGETLKSLVATGALANHKGTWVGWNARDFSLPGSIRDAVITRLARLSTEVQAVAELATVIGSRAPYPLLASISGLEEPQLIAALEQLVATGLLVERAEGGRVVYDFRYPVVRQVLYEELGLQRSRLLHGAIAEAMEAYWGDAALQHADELAYHFARTDAERLSLKAVTYLMAAGQAALDRHADREATEYLQAALERVTGSAGGDDDGMPPGLVTDLARCYLRLGEYETARELWGRAERSSEPGTTAHAALCRLYGLTTFWCGRHGEAFDVLDRGLESAARAGDRATRIRLRLARFHCLQELGRARDALEEVRSTLPEAEALGDPGLLGRVHRSLALLHVWTSPPAADEEHDWRAIELAQQAADLQIEFWARWGLAVLWGMTGDARRMAEGLDELMVLADRARSPVLKLWTTEMAIEHAYATGRWEEGITMGEHSVDVARNLNQGSLLARLLVLTSMFYLGRGDLDRAKALVDEAREISGTGGAGKGSDIYQVVPALTGLAHYRVAVGEYEEGVAAARRALEVAEETGFHLLVVHRLLPILAEGCLWAGRIDEAEAVGRRLRGHAEKMDHKLGIAWADACDALVAWKRGDPERGAQGMIKAAEELEEIPMIPYAVRIRRQLAARLRDIGETEQAVEELRRIHDVFAKLGAEVELEKTRTQMRELGVRPPPKGKGEGMAGLTARELQVARLVARRKSNKAVGKVLGISDRTVSTHLSNIYGKLGVTGRTQLGDFIRDQGLLQD